MKRITATLLLSLFTIMLISCSDDDNPVDPGDDTPPQIVFKNFGGDDDDWGRAVAQSGTKDYVICGSTDSYGSGLNTGYLLKIDSLGGLVWGNLLGGNGDDNCEDIIVKPSGEVYVAGVTSSYSSSHDFYFVKTDVDGNVVWEKTYGSGSDLEWATSLKELSGGFVLGGYASGTPSLDQFYLVKTDLNGNLVWENTYGTPDIDWAHDMDLTDDDGFIMAGITRVNGTSVNSPFFVKADADGDFLWNHKIEIANSDTHIKCVKTVSDGGYVGGGYNWPFSGNNKETYLVKLNSDGSFAWSKIYNTVRPNLICEDIYELPDGSLLLTGSPINTMTTSGNLVVMKVAADGTFMWTKTYEPTANAEGMTIDSNGNLVITGFDYAHVGANPNVLFIRIPADSL